MVREEFSSGGKTNIASTLSRHSVDSLDAFAALIV